MQSGGRVYFSSARDVFPDFRTFSSTEMRVLPDVSVILVTTVIRARDIGLS